jgi:hypothetical protein
MGRHFRFLTVSWLVLLAVTAGAQDSDGRDAPAYVAPYGLSKTDLGPITAPNFLRAILGDGTEAEQNAALTALASDRSAADGKEIRSVADNFKRTDTGVQAVVWRDTSSGKLKRASDKTGFDPKCDRLEVLFTKFDLKALKAQNDKATVGLKALKELLDKANPATEGSKEWVANIAKAEKKDPKDFQAGQGLAGPLGGSGDFNSGNIFPVSQKAKDKIGEVERTLILLAQTVETSPTIVVLVVYEYPDGKSRIPSKVQYYYAVEKSLWGGCEAQNK